MSLADEGWKDLYLGDSFCDVKGLDGQMDSQPAPERWQHELTQLRQLCYSLHEKKGSPEFALAYGNRSFRVVRMDCAYGGCVFVLRKSTAYIRNFNELGYPHIVNNFLLAKTLRGLVLFTGDMSSGKTSSAASLVAKRLQQQGGVGFAIEDPVETILDGQFNKGRCIQIEVNRFAGGYSETLIRILRTAADLVLVGEIRDEHTANEVVRASLNGHLLISTIHAKSVGEAIQKLITLAKPYTDNAHEVVADALTAVIHQKLVESPFQKNHYTLIAEPLLLRDEQAIGIREKIRRNEMHLIRDEQYRQAMQHLWEP